MKWNAFHPSQYAGDSHWALQTSPPGVLHVRSRESALSYDDLHDLVKRLLAERVDESLAEIVFDFSDVSTIEAPWTLVVAQLVDFARRSRAACRITSLRGQPAAIVSLLLGDGAYPSPLHIEEPSPVQLN